MARLEVSIILTSGGDKAAEEAPEPQGASSSDAAGTGHHAADGDSALGPQGSGTDSMSVDVDAKRKANSEKAAEYTNEVIASAAKKSRGQSGEGAADRPPAAERSCG